MTASTAARKTDELLEVLAEDIRHLETTLSTLDHLRGLLIKRDDAGLQELLAQIAHGSDARAVLDRKRETLRAELAGALGCEGDRLTLSALQTLVPDGQRKKLIERQKRLKTLASDLRREYRLTARLVSDCARFNRSLMRIVFGLDGKDTLTYSPRGTVKHRENAALMNLRL
ncbi:MAG: flagellar export chaperone FlgN [Sedimentisphaerales bacterium]|nr:flagellar export chaperone FlgN [Sedimentisphaerales bacterium]